MPDYEGSLDLTVNGDLTVAALEMVAGKNLTLNVKGNLIMAPDINLGNGNLTLTADGSIIAAGQLQANQAVVTAFGRIRRRGIRTHHAVYRFDYA